MQEPVDGRAAVVDRLTFNAHIIQTGSSSYRLNATARSRKEPATTCPPSPASTININQGGARTEEHSGAK
jgi:hypothetical protein